MKLILALNRRMANIVFSISSDDGFGSACALIEPTTIKYTYKYKFNNYEYMHQLKLLLNAYLSA